MEPGHYVIPIVYRGHGRSYAPTGYVWTWKFHKDATKAPFVPQSAPVNMPVPPIPRIIQRPSKTIKYWEWTVPRTRGASQLQVLSTASQDGTAKITPRVRQHYTVKLYDICVKIYKNNHDAASRALNEENDSYERCTSLIAYNTLCELSIERLKKELSVSTATGTKSTRSEQPQPNVYRGSTFHSSIKKWILSEPQLEDHGFPRPHPDGSKGRAKLYKVGPWNQHRISKINNDRICCRCNKEYMVDENGVVVHPQQCIYHWGRPVWTGGKKIYTCCQHDALSTGCCEAATHVWDYVDTENQYEYVQTLPNGLAISAVYALDCEMSYTTHGLELTRVTVVDDKCNIVYETLVKPDNPIIDYNTRFSGITASDMVGLRTTLRDVQAMLLSIIDDQTILVGHSLDSDFKALKLIHLNVVDTSVLFPHYFGYPRRRKLKDLCFEYLQRDIQNDAGSHDSAEDAMAAMDLVQWRYKQDAKTYT